MSDTENEVQQQEVEETQETPVEQPKKKKRVISPEAKKVMLENLAKAREAKKKELKNPGVRLSKYPKEKRERAKEMYEEDVDRKAEEKAKELAQKLIEEEKQKQVMEEFKAWKESQKHAKESTPAPSKKKAPPKAAKAAPKAVKKPKTPAKKVVKRRLVEEESEDEGYFDPSPAYGGHISYGGVSIDDFLS